MYSDTSKYIQTKLAQKTNNKIIQRFKLRRKGASKSLKEFNLLCRLPAERKLNQTATQHHRTSRQREQSSTYCHLHQSTRHQAAGSQFKQSQIPSVANTLQDLIIILYLMGRMDGWWQNPSLNQPSN